MITRDEVVALLRHRLSDNDVVDLAARRHAPGEPPLELVPVALTLAAERQNAAPRVAAAIPRLTEECRNLLRLRLQGQSFEEISEQLEMDAVSAYARCRQRLFPASKPLPDYGAGLLSDEERLTLFEDALKDPGLFQSLRDEHALLVMMEDPATRASLLEATENVEFTVTGTLQEWFERPRSKLMVLIGVLAGLVLIVQECGK